MQARRAHAAPCSAPRRAIHQRAPMRPPSVRRAEAKAPAAGAAPAAKPEPKPQLPPQLRPRTQLEDIIKINEQVKPDHDATRGSVSAVEGIPEYELGRRVFISRPAKSMTQAGNTKTQGWKITYQHEDRWRNPLMGWTSTRDPYTNLSLTFTSLEEAIEYELSATIARSLVRSAPNVGCAGTQRSTTSSIRSRARAASSPRTSSPRTTATSSCISRRGRASPIKARGPGVHTT